MTHRGRRAGLGALAIALLATASSPTTNDESKATDPSSAPVTTVVPAGTPEELLPLMLAEVQALPSRVSNNDGAGAAAERIEQLWAAIEPAIRATDPDLVMDFEFVVRRCRAAADHKRPADADRAFKNLDALVDAYLA
jgi:hypothetical protein